MRMLAVLALVLGLVVGEQNHHALPVGEERAARSMKFEIEPLKERYCKGYPDVGTLQIESLLRFTNTSKAPLIFYKGSGAIYRHRTAKSLADMEARNLEYEMRTQIMYAEDTSLRDLLRPDPKGFAILDPDQSFAIKQLIPVTIKSAGSKSRAALAPGDYFVQVDVETWPESTDLGVVLAKRWEKWGKLWYSPLTTSEPLHVTIAENPKLEECP
jgi:hypothetical protein